MNDDNIDPEKAIQELAAYEQEHNNLNQLLDDKAQLLKFDRLTLQRMKKRKLWLKDQISHLQSLLYPNIIA